MKNKNKSISVHLPPIKIYLDDIDKIISILNEANPDEINLETNDKHFKYEELSKLKKTKIDELDIIAKFPDFSCFTITINSQYSGDVYLYCHTNSIKYQGIAKKIEDLLTIKKRVFVNFMFNIKLYFIAMIFATGLFSFYAPKFIVNGIHTRIDLLIFATICFGYLIFILNFPPFASRLNKSIIFLTYQKDNSGF